MRRYLPLAIFLSVALAILVMAGFAYFATEEASRIKFAATADDAVSRIESRVELNLSLLKATRALFDASNGAVSRAEFDAFFSALDLEHDFDGLRGVGFLPVLKNGDEETAERLIRESHGIDRPVYPDSNLPLRMPIVLFEPHDETSKQALGYDMYTDPPRREAIDRVLAGEDLGATAPLLLGQAQGGQTFPGLLVFEAVTRPAVAGAETAPQTTGLLFAAFRARELFNAALLKDPLLPVNVEVFDGMPAEESLLYQSETPPANMLGERLAVSRELTVGGRKWIVRFRPTSGFVEPTSRFIPLMLGIAGLLLAAAIAMGARYQSRAYEAIETLQQTMQKSLVERDLMLQEMKHRIKNSIARVLAIARQTASGAATIQEFSSSFSSRLQAMALSQDMLTRSSWQKADLRRLLTSELDQVFGQDAEGLRVSGPPVELGESATQALGLVFHELATNALKYADRNNTDVSIDVAWSVKNAGGERLLSFKWEEGGQTEVSPPSKTGFGTRLIDMNITRELGGTINRDYQPEGLKIQIEFPLG